MIILTEISEDHAMSNEHPNYAVNYDGSEISRCLLCHDPVCSKACPQGADPAGVLRSLYFRNYISALDKATCDCTYCNAPCEKACVLSDFREPVAIRKLLMSLTNTGDDLPSMRLDHVDLSTDICGVKLENPFLLSSSVVSSSYDMCKRAFEAGWAGASFKTICNFPQHETSPRFSSLRHHSNAFCGFKNIEQLSDHSVEENMQVFRQLRDEFPTKVMIASIMGRNEDEWTYLASECERSGASVIECNFSCPNMESDDLGMTIGQSEELVERFTAAVRRGTSLPVLAKLTPNVADMVPLALAARRGGADGIAAINTINSISGVDIDTLVAEPSVSGKTIIGGYSGVSVRPIALRFISDISRCSELSDMHISGMGGIENWIDALEFILLGAGSVQVTTAVMQYGYRIIDDLISGLEYYMKAKGISSLDKLVGGASMTVVDHQSIQRDTILLPVFDYELCNGCGRCYISCMDGGHQAIEFDEKTRRPRLNGSKCVGCHLCRLVCPYQAINTAGKTITRQ